MACTQVLGRPLLVDAFDHYSPWVMPGVIRLKYNLMADANPYKPPANHVASQSSQVAGRFLVIAIHISLLFGILLGGPLLSAFIGAQSDSGVLETELTGLDDFFRAFANYSFVPFMLILLLDLPVYFAIRILKGRPTRWRWLCWTTAVMPIVVLLYWLVLWPLVRIPIEI